ncbi:MAG: hypothetical protein ACI9YL_000063 [Luteibaculaceae bacterium]|jgi:hypothetical protein
MSRHLILFILFLAPFLGTSQYYRNKENQALSIGYREAGGGYIGVEYEYRIAGPIGILAGLGLSSSSLGITYHLDPGDFESHFFSFEFNQLGFAEQKEYWALGPFYNFRKINLTGAFGYIVRSTPDNTLNKTHRLDLKNGTFSFSLGFYFMFE